MNRPIKFRAWSGTAMMYGHGCYTDENDRQWLQMDGGRYSGEALMQFTGLTDKNGRDVYEGDIVKVGGWNPELYEVVFNRGGFCLKFGADSSFYPDIKYAEEDRGGVIGNIYENPELLETLST